MGVTFGEGSGESNDGVRRTTPNWELSLEPPHRFRLRPGLIRIPDAAFFSWSRWSNEEVRKNTIASLVPDLAIKMISHANTKLEMDRKLYDYFTAGVAVVWYFDVTALTATVYRSIQHSFTLDEKGILAAGDLLAGFQLALSELFTPPSWLDKSSDQ